MIALHIAPCLRPGGGPAGYCYNLMQGSLAAPGQSPDVEFRFHGVVGGRSTSATSGRAFRLKARAKIWLEYLGLKDVLRRSGAHSNGSVQALLDEISGADVVVFHGPALISVLRHCQKAGKKIVYMPHSPSISADEHEMILRSNGIRLPAKVYRQRFAEEKAFFDAADIVVFPSPGASEQYRQRYDIPDASIQYIPSGVPNPALAVETVAKEKHDGPIVALFAGRYVDHKGYDIFCEAAALRDYDNVQFTTAGTGPLERPYTNVTNLGWRSDIFNVIMAADFVVIPNRISYYDLLPLECAALGKPIILTNVGGSKDQAELLPDSLLAKADDPESLAETIEAAATKIRQQPGWGKKNVQAFHEKFSAESMSARWGATLRDNFDIK